jgi:hypothetical protein
MSKELLTDKASLINYCKDHSLILHVFPHGTKLVDGVPQHIYEFSKQDFQNEDGTVWRQLFAAVQPSDLPARTHKYNGFVGLPSNACVSMSLFNQIDVEINGAENDLFKATK